MHERLRTCGDAHLGLRHHRKSDLGFTSSLLVFLVSINPFRRQNFDSILAVDVTCSTPDGSDGNGIPGILLVATNASSLTIERLRLAPGTAVEVTTETIEKECSLHNRQRWSGHSRHHGCQRGNAHESQLQEGVVLADGRRVDLSRGERKIPIAHESLRWRQRDPPVVDGRDGQGDVSAKNDYSEPYCCVSPISSCTLCAAAIVWPSFVRPATHLAKRPSSPTLPSRPS